MSNLRETIRPSADIRNHYNEISKQCREDKEIMGNENNLYFDFGGSVTIARVSKYEVKN